MTNTSLSQVVPQSREGVYIYIRVSTGRQVLGTGLETQERDCRSYAQNQGWVVLRVFREEGESAKTAKRTQLLEMLREAQTASPRPSYVLIHALDRFARNGIDHDALREQLLKLNIKLRCVLTPLGETPYDRYIERVLSGLPQLDNELRGERSLAGMKMRVEQGKWTFKAPLGYVNDRDEQGNKTLLRDPKRADLVAESFELYATGLYTKEQVRERINAKGLRTHKGEPVGHERFDRMLRNPLYAGVLDIEKWGVSAKGTFEPIVTMETFQTVRDVLQGRRRTVTPRQRNRVEFPLRNFVACGYCHKPLTGSPSRGKMGVKYNYYRCQNPCCPSKPRTSGRVEAMHELFVQFLREQQPDSTYLRLFHKVVFDVWQSKQIDAAALTRTFERQIAELKERKHKLLEAMVYQQTLTRAEYDEMRAPLDEQLSTADANLIQSRAAEVSVEKVIEFAEDLLLNVAGVWERCSLDQKQRLQQVLFPRGVEYADGRYRTQETSFLFKGLPSGTPVNEVFGSANGNRTRV
jgi:site-specific DNA recombinase